MAYQQQQGTYQYDTQQYYAAAQTAAYPAYSSQTSSSQSAYATSYTDQTASYAGYPTAASNASQATVSNVNTAYQSTDSSYYQPSYSTVTTTSGSASATASTTQANTSYYSQQPASQPTQSYDAYQAYYQASSATPSADSAYQGQSYYAQTQPQTQGVANSATASYSTSTGTTASTSSSTSYPAYNNTYAYSTSQQQPSQTATQNQYYDYTSYGSQATSAATTATGTSYYDTSQYTAQKQTPSNYATVASNVGSQSQAWAGQNSAYNSSATYSQPQGQYSQPQSYGYTATTGSAAAPSQYGYSAGSEASSSGGSHFAASRNFSTPAVPQNNQANRNTRPNVNAGGYNQRDQYSNRSTGRQTQGYKQDTNKGYTAYARSSSGGNQNSRAAPSIPSWQGNEGKKSEAFNRRGFDQRPASNNFQQTRQPQQQGRQPKFERRPPFQSSSNQGARDPGHQQKNERFDRTQGSDFRGRKEEQGRFSGQRRNAPDQHSSRRQGTFGQLKELQRSDVPAATFTQKRDHQGNFRGKQARETGRGPNDNLRPVMTSPQAGQSKNQPIPNKPGYERNKSDPRGGGKQDQPRAHRQEKSTPPGPKPKTGPPERKPPIRNSQQSSEGGNKFSSDKKVDSGKSGMGPPNENMRFRGPHPMVPRGPGPMSPRGRFPPPRFPGDEMPFMPRPFGPRGPFPPGERMFGPPMRGMGRFRGRPGGPRPRFPFPRLPPPWELDPPMFPGDLRPPPPYFDEFDDHFMEDEFDPDIPPHMFPPRKRRRSSGSPHRGDRMPPMGRGRRPGSPDHFMDMEGPFEFGPRGPPFRPFPPGNFHPMMPPKLPLKNAIPPFRGTKEVKAKKQKQDQQKTNKLDKPKVKEEKDFKFNCEVCDCGFPKESELEEHNKLHEKCQVEGCGLEAIPAVLKNHVKQQHEADLPPVEWSRDQEDTNKWIEERKKKYPSAANIASKKETEKEKERVGAVLTTKEFGKVKKKKLVSSGKEEEKVSEKQEAAEVEASGDVEDVDNKEKDEKDAERLEEKNDEKDSETGDGMEGVKKDAEGEAMEEMSTEETTTNPEKDDVGQKTEEIQEAEGSTDGDKDGKSVTKTETEEVVKKEVIYQPVKKEIVKRFKRDKSSKREAWRTSKPVQKIITKGGRHRRATLLEMLLAPEVRHERNMVLQCVRHTVNKNFFEPKEEPVVEEKKDPEGENDVKLEEMGKKEKSDTDEKEVLGGKEESGEVEDVKGKDESREEKDEDAEMIAAEPEDKGEGENVEKKEKEESKKKMRPSRKRKK